MRYISGFLSYPTPADTFSENSFIATYKGIFFRNKWVKLRGVPRVFFHKDGQSAVDQLHKGLEQNGCYTVLTNIIMIVFAFVPKGNICRFGYFCALFWSEWDNFSAWIRWRLTSISGLPTRGYSIVPGFMARITRGTRNKMRMLVAKSIGEWHKKQPTIIYHSTVRSLRWQYHVFRHSGLCKFTIHQAFHHWLIWLSMWCTMTN